MHLSKKTYIALAAIAALVLIGELQSRQIRRDVDVLLEDIEKERKSLEVCRYVITHSDEYAPSVVALAWKQVQRYEDAN